MAAQILETTVTPSATGDVVQLVISDAPLGDEQPSFRLTLLAKLSPLKPAMLAQLERQAMARAVLELQRLLQEKATALQTVGREPLPMELD